MHNISKKEVVFLNTVPGKTTWNSLSTNLGLELNFFNLVQVRKKRRKRNSVGRRFETEKTHSIFFFSTGKATFNNYKLCAMIHLRMLVSWLFA